MLALIEYIAKALVEDTTQVVVRERMSDNGETRIIELQVAPDDRGKVIGKRGRMAHTMRTLLAAASSLGKPTTLEIID